jgi:hypothetical protein
VTSPEVTERKEMSDELFDQLEAIFAYDQGATNSGVHDEQLRRRLCEEFDALSEEEARLRLSRWIRDGLLGEKALAEGYGWEDARDFLNWIDFGAFRSNDG